MEKNVTFSFDTASDEEDDITFHIDVPISEAELTGWVNKDILWIFNEHVPRSVGFTSLQMGRCFFFDSIWASSNKHFKLKRNFDLNFHVNLSNVDHTRTGCHFTHSADFNILVLMVLMKIFSICPFIPFVQGIITWWTIMQYFSNFVLSNFYFFQKSFVQYICPVLMEE